MKRIKIRGVLKDDLIRRVLLNSDRKYENIELKGDYSTDVQSLFSAKERRWTNIAINRANFETVEHFLKFLRIFQSSIEKMVLFAGKVNENDEVNAEEFSDLQFP